MATKIQLRRDISANWAGTNPTLSAGEPGIELDTNKLKVGDGMTAWNDLDYLTATLPNESTTESLFVKLEGVDDNTYYLPWAGVVSVSSDGLNWTPGTFNAEFTTHQEWDILNATVGGGRMIYITYEYGTDRNELRWAHNPFEKPVAPTSDLVRAGPHGEDINWNNVRFAGDKYIACGSYYDSVRSDYYYPYVIYSTDGNSWSKVAIDLDHVAGLIAAERTANSNDVNGLEATDVAYGIDGWLITAHWGPADGTNLSRNPAGAWYVNSLTTTLNVSTWTVQIPGAWIAAFDGHGWVAWANYDTNLGGPAFYFNSNNDPRVGSWRTVDYQQTVFNLTGRSNNYCILGVAAGEVAGANWIVVADGKYGAIATADQGITWRVIETEAFSDPIYTISATNPVGITSWDNAIPHSGERVTISGSNVAQLNGTFYADYTNGPAGFGIYLYTGWDGSSFSGPVDGTSWGGVDVYHTKSVTGRYGQYTVVVNSTANLEVGMAAAGETPLTGYVNEYEDSSLELNLIQSIDHANSTITMKYPWHGTDGATETIDFTPVLKRSEGDGLHSVAYGDGAFVGFGWNQTARSYKTTDMMTWQTATRASEALGRNQPWDLTSNPYIAIMYGAVTTHGALLRSKSNAISGYTNFLSLSDTFQLNVVNGDPEWTIDGSQRNFGNGIISIDPQLGHWVMGTTNSNEGYWGSGEGYYGYTASIQSFSSGEGYADGNNYFDSVRIQTFNNKVDFRSNGYIVASSISIEHNNEGYNNFNLNGDSVIEGIYFHNSGNTSIENFSNKTIYIHEGQLKLDSAYGYQGEGASILSFDNETNYTRVDYYGTRINTEGYAWDFTDDCNGDTYGVLYAPDNGLIQTAGWWKYGDYNSDWSTTYIAAYQSNYQETGLLTGTIANIDANYFDITNLSVDTSTLETGWAVYQVSSQGGNFYNVDNHQYAYNSPIIDSILSSNSIRIYDQRRSPAASEEGNVTFYAYDGGPKDISIVANDTRFVFDRRGRIVLPDEGDLVNINLDSVIYGLPQNNVSVGDYTLTYGDRNKHIYRDSVGDIYIPTNANVAFPIGTTISVITDAHLPASHIHPENSGVTTVILAGSGVNNDITTTANNWYNLLKIATDKWIVKS
jgi:Major tropism determinant N-terminal domain